MVNEIWKPVFPPFDKKYEVSNMGRVRNIKQIQCLTPFMSHARGRETYPTVALYYGQKKFKKFMIHQLVATVFIGERPEGFVVDHINRDMCDNRDLNLRYVSKSDNQKGTHFGTGYKQRIIKGRLAAF